MNENQQLQAEKLDQATEMLKAIAHPVRLSIVHLLEGGKRLSVTEIFQTLNLEQANASHHLRILKDKGVLSLNREGKNIYYFLKHSQLTQVIRCIERCCDS